MEGNDAPDGAAQAPLSNAERQRRFRERKKEQAAAGDTGAEFHPARGYSWPPFEPGHPHATRLHVIDVTQTC